MKNSKEYSKKVQKLYCLLRREYPKVKKAVYDEPADALVYAIVSENMSETAAESAIKRFTNYFVDLNDLRVSRAEEIVEMLGEDTPVTRDTASTLTRALRAAFEQYHAVSLASLKRIGKRPAKQVLEKMDAVSRFAVNYCMLTSLQGHAIPLTKKMIEYLRSNELVHAAADEQETEGFLTKQISAENAYEFYALLRRESESRKGRIKKKAKKVKSKKATIKRKKTKAKKKTKK
jgi:endonuclease III